MVLIYYNTRTYTHFTNIFHSDLVLCFGWINIKELSIAEYGGRRDCH